MGLASWLGRALGTLPRGLVAKLAGEPLTIRGRTLDPWVQLIARGSAKQLPMHRMTPAEARASNDRAITLGAGAPRSMAAIEHRMVTGAESDLPARLYRPHDLAGPRPLLLYFHQGGCVIGNLDWAESFCMRIAETARCLVLSTTYRLGPEHRFPAAQEDAIAIYRWVLHHAESLGADPARIAVGGDSAGGGLSAHITHAARSAGDLQPLLQLLVYPWLHAFADNAAYQEFGDCFPLSREDMRWIGSHYMNDPSEREDPRLSPILERSFEGLAPAIIARSGFDLLCDEADAYAEKLEQAGVSVVRRAYDELCHGFTSIGGTVPAADRALDELASDVERALTGAQGVRG
jgi:acetyl esterase/lipase